MDAVDALDPPLPVAAAVILPPAGVVAPPVQPQVAGPIGQPVVRRHSHQVALRTVQVRVQVPPPPPMKRAPTSDQARALIVEFELHVERRAGQAEVPITSAA